MLMRFWNLNFLEYIVFYSWPFLVSWQAAEFINIHSWWQIIIIILLGIVIGYCFNETATFSLFYFYADNFTTKLSGSVPNSVWWLGNQVALFVSIIAAGCFWLHQDTIAWILLLFNIFFLIPYTRSLVSKLPHPH